MANEPAERLTRWLEGVDATGLPDPLGEQNRVSTHVRADIERDHPWCHRRAKCCVFERIPRQVAMFRQDPYQLAGRKRARQSSSAGLQEPRGVIRRPTPPAQPRSEWNTTQALASGIHQRVGPEPV